VRRLRLLLAPVLLMAGAAQAQTFPKFTGLVVDDANVLPPAVEADLTAKLSALQRETKRQLVVATIADVQGYPLEDYGYRLGRAWGVGLKDVDNGAILFVAPNNPAGQRGPRIEVGQGLEPIVTDAFAGQVIRRDMMPRLKAGDIAGAMTAGTDALVAQLRSSPEEARARTDVAAAAFDRANRSSANRSGGGVPVALIFWMIIFAVVVLPMFRRRSKAGPWGRRHRRGGLAGDVLLWAVANQIGQSSGRSSGWGGGGGGWGGGGGGGWTGGGFSGGGGGSFGGGGASGSW
jgi:uncharacterized protein